MFVSFVMKPIYRPEPFLNINRNALRHFVSVHFDAKDSLHNLKQLLYNSSICGILKDRRNDLDCVILTRSVCDDIKQELTDCFVHPLTSQKLHDLDFCKASELAVAVWMFHVGSGYFRIWQSQRAFEHILQTFEIYRKLQLHRVLSVTHQLLTEVRIVAKSLDACFAPDGFTIDVTFHRKNFARFTLRFDTLQKIFVYPGFLNPSLSLYNCLKTRSSVKRNIMDEQRVFYDFTYLNDALNTGLEKLSYTGNPYRRM